MIDKMVSRRGSPGHIYHIHQTSASTQRGWAAYLVFFLVGIDRRKVAGLVVVDDCIDIP